MLNFYRRFLPGIARVLQPLTDATSGKGKLLWTSEMQFAFDHAKALLASAVPLQHPHMLLALMLAQFCNKKQMAAGYCWLSFLTSFLQRKAVILLLIVNFLQLSKRLNLFDFF